MPEDLLSSSSRDGSGSTAAEQNHSGTRSTSGNESVARNSLVAEARSYLGTPYKRGAMVKGEGTDCATFLFLCLRSQGLIPDEKIGVFSHDWWAHTKEDTYIRRMLRHASKVAEAICYPSLEALPGNVILCKAARSRVYNHGALVTEWPRAIEAIFPAVRELDITRDPLWAQQQIVLLDPFRKEEYTVKEVHVGDPVVYVDPVGKQSNALVTAVWGPKCINLVLVSADKAKEDSYGRQIERQTSMSYKDVNNVHGFYWMFPGDEPNPVVEKQE